MLQHSVHEEFFNVFADEELKRNKENEQKQQFSGVKNFAITGSENRRQQNEQQHQTQERGKQRQDPVKGGSSTNRVPSNTIGSSSATETKNAAKKGIGSFSDDDWEWREKIYDNLFPVNKEGGSEDHERQEAKEKELQKNSGKNKDDERHGHVVGSSQKPTEVENSATSGGKGVIKERNRDKIKRLIHSVIF